MHICKYHLKDDKCYLKNICKVKHPKLQRYYQRISMHKLFCDQSGKIFLNDYGWMIWLSHDMTNSADLNGYHITSPAFGICLYHSPSSFGRRRPRTYFLSNYKHNCMFISTGPSGLLKTTSGTMCSRFTPTHTLQQVQHRDRLQSSETRLGKSSQLLLSLEFFFKFGKFSVAGTILFERLSFEWTFWTNGIALFHSAVSFDPFCWFANRGRWELNIAVTSDSFDSLTLILHCFPLGNSLALVFNFVEKWYCRKFRELVEARKR